MSLPSRFTDALLLQSNVAVLPLINGYSPPPIVASYLLLRENMGVRTNSMTVCANKHELLRPAARQAFPDLELKPPLEFIVAN